LKDDDINGGAYVIRKDNILY